MLQELLHRYKHHWPWKRAHPAPGKTELPASFRAWLESFVRDPHFANALWRLEARDIIAALRLAVKNEALPTAN